MGWLQDNLICTQSLAARRFSKTMAVQPEHVHAELIFRIYLKRSGYMKSYILRYLEEALAETYAHLRVNGFEKEYVLQGLAFPLGKQYEIRVSRLRQEAKGFHLGPITVGTMFYNVFEGVRSQTYD